MEYVADRAPAGWREAHASESDPDNPGYTPLSETQEVDSNARKSAWTRLITGFKGQVERIVPSRTFSVCLA